MNIKDFDKKLEDLAFNYPDKEIVDPFALFERQEDMSPDGKLSVIIQEDGDGIIRIIPPTEENTFGPPTVEFCTRTGGGKSPRIVRAIRVLAWAIALDNLNLGMSQ